MKYIKYLSLAIRFVAIADREQVLETIISAIKDKKLSGNELIDIGRRLCKAANIDLDETGIKL